MNQKVTSSQKHAVANSSAIPIPQNEQRNHIQAPAKDTNEQRKPPLAKDTNEHKNNQQGQPDHQNAPQTMGEISDNDGLNHDQDPQPTGLTVLRATPASPPAAPPEHLFARRISKKVKNSPSHVPVAPPRAQKGIGEAPANPGQTQGAGFGLGAPAEATSNCFPPRG